MNVTIITTFAMGAIVGLALGFSMSAIVGLLLFTGVRGNPREEAEDDSSARAAAPFPAPGGGSRAAVREQNGYSRRRESDQNQGENFISPRQLL